MDSGTKLITLGDLYADTCHCGERATYGEAKIKGPDGCVEAINTGRVFCESHIPNRLLKKVVE